MKRSTWLGLALFVVFATTCAAGAWTTLTDAPTPRSWHAAVAMDGNVVVIGGILSFAEPVYTSVEAYDPTTERWTPKTDAPTPKAAAAATVVDRKVFVFGGAGGPWPPSATADVYDATTDQWSSAADMLRTRSGATAASVDGKIYVFGGLSEPDGDAASTTQVFDPATNQWDIKTPSPTARWYPTASVLEGKIYVIGGANQWPGDALATVEIYDPQTDTWTKAPKMPTARSHCASAVVGGLLYVIGGFDSSNEQAKGVNTVEVFQPSTQRWLTMSGMSQGRGSLTAVPVGQDIYVVGGAAEFGSPALSLVEVYTPGSDVVTSVHPRGKIAALWGSLKAYH